MKDLRLTFCPLLLAVLLLSGCSAVGIHGQDSRLPATTDSLWEIRIRQWDKERFAGLLTVRTSDTGMQTALLDPTGIKLLEAGFDETGDPTIISALEVVQRKGLPQFLTGGLQKIFFRTPEIATCSGSIFFRVCHEQIARRKTRKKAVSGPVPLWSVEYHLSETSPDKILAAELNAPWYGTKFTMRVLN